MDNADHSGVEAEAIRDTLVIRFRRPRERNPLSLRTLCSLRSILTSRMTDDELRTIIFTGTHDVFASGADIRELQNLNAATASDFSRLGQEVFQLVAQTRQLTIAAVNGYCIGGALDLALACDIRIASTNAVFAHPGATLGIITGWGGTQRLPRTICRSQALDLFLTARRIQSEEALRIGLVTAVADPVLDYAMTIANQNRALLSSSIQLDARAE